MAHERPRFIEEAIKFAMGWSPSIAISGMRQTGKTTVIKRHSKTYFSFDDQALLALFEREGVSILQKGPFPLALDEAQKNSGIFDQLKYVIDQRKTPGRYFLTGSVRFSSRKQIRESLTGRSMSLDLYPMTLAECHSKSAEFSIEILMARPLNKIPGLLERKAWASASMREHFLVTGGLPGICFKRDPAIRDELHEQHLDTLLGRDIYFLTKTRLRHGVFRKILEYVVLRQGAPIKNAEIAREINVSPPTARDLLFALEGLFLIRKHGRTWFLEDCGLAHFLAPTIVSSAKSRLLGLLYHEIRAQLGYSRELSSVDLGSFETRGGAEVEFLLSDRKTGKRVAITFDAAENVSEKKLKSLQVYAKKFKNVCMVGVHCGDRLYVTPKGILCLPLEMIF